MYFVTDSYAIDDCYNSDHDARNRRGSIDRGPYSVCRYHNIWGIDRIDCQTLR